MSIDNVNTQHLINTKTDENIFKKPIKMDFNFNSTRLPEVPCNMSTGNHANTQHFLPKDIQKNSSQNLNKINTQVS